MKNLTLILSLLTTLAASAQTQFTTGQSWKIGDSTLVGSVEYYAKRNILEANAIPKEGVYWTMTRIITAPTIVIDYKAKYDSVVTEYVAYKSDAAKEIDALNKLIDSIIKPMPVIAKTKRYYSSHFMTAFQHHSNDLEGWVKRMKAAGYNTIWAHSDTYGGYYKTNLDTLFKLAAKFGMEIMPGVHGSAADNIAMIADSWGKSSLLHINGKPVFTGWNYRGEQRPVIQKYLDSVGIFKKDYLLVPHTWIPYTWDLGKTYVGERFDTTLGVKVWAITNAIKPDFGGALQMGHLYDTRTELDGYNSMSVDQYGKIDFTILTNRLGNLESKKRGKIFFAGINGFYASASYTDYGFEGLAKQWMDILAQPDSLRPIGVTDATADDYVELSYMSPMLNVPENGLVYLPAKGRGYNLGTKMRYPITDHSGMQAFVRPYVDAFLNNDSAPVFTTDKIFCWYWLHPKTAPVMPNIPTELQGLKSIDTTWWKGTVYGSTPYQVYAIQTYMPATMDNIRVGVHLTKSAYLKINDTVSELKPAGAAWFEIPQAGFRGVPVFSIVNEDGTIRKTATGPQPITDNRWPGGFNPLVTEIN